MLTKIPSCYVTVIITGPTSGIGLELVHYLLKEDFKLVFIGRNLDRLNPLIAKHLYKIILIECDLSESVLNHKSQSLRDKVQFIIENDNNEKIILINNAGSILPIKKIGNFFQEKISESFSVNLFSTFSIISGIRENKNWSKIKLYIINISSGAADHPISGWSIYCSSKAAVKMLLNVFQLEESEKVTVEHFDPGCVDTNMQVVIRSAQKSDFSLLNEFIDMQKNGSLKKPNLIAKEIIDRINYWINR